MEKEDKNESRDDLVPVSLLCGFLGAGKTTMLKHILETKHAEEDFKCAVIVNDMAALNIDKSLIDKSALVQSDEVIAMQNGCFCCTLQSDLVDQIISLCSKNMFNYILIEASGVTEPSQIAPLFNLCDDEHDPEDPEADHDHDGKPQLGEVARLDTCVTVVDSAEFYNNLDSMNTFEQGLYKPIENKDGFWIETSMVAAEERFEAEYLECCEKANSIEGKKCCKSNSGKFIESDLSQVQLGVLPNSNEERKLTRHEKRFGITSFIYRARRPFHPGRLCDFFLEPYFPDMKNASNDDDNDSSDEEDDYSKDKDNDEDEDFEIEWTNDDKEQNTDEDEKKTRISEEEKHSRLIQIQEDASIKQKLRTERLGELLRSKGFIWIATCHNVMGEWQQAGNIIKIEAETSWMCEVREAWMGTPSEDLVMKDILQSNGEEHQFGDRRQELVFIGQNLKHEVIQGVLDSCLLNDEEMILGPEVWKDEMDEDDRIQYLIFNGVYWKVGSLFLE